MCVVGSWVDGWVGCICVVLVLGDGIYALMRGENDVGLLEGFFDY